MPYEGFTILRPNVLTGLIQELYPPESVFTKLFTQNTIPGEFHIAEWDEIEGGRDIQKHANVESPARPVVLTGVRKRTAHTARIFLKKTIPNSRVSWLREPGRQTRERLERVINFELEDLNNAMERTIEKSCADALFEGIINISQPSDATHELYAKISFPITFMSATASWASATTKIIGGAGELPKVRTAMQSAIGQNPAHCFGKDDLARAFYNSSFIQTFLNDVDKGALLRDHRLKFLDGIEWNYNDHGYKAAGTTFTTYAKTSHCVFLPTNWQKALGFITAPEMMTNKTGVASLSDLHYTQGKFAYVKILDEPVAIQILVGINYLPVIMRPSYVIRYNHTGS